MADGITIENSASLGNLGGLVNLQAVVTLVLVNAPAVTELNLPIGGLDVLHLENLGLTTLDGLTGITRIEKATIQNNPNLVHIDRLGALESLEEMSVLNNPNLVRLPEFGALGTVEQVYVRNNALLATGPSYPLVAEAGTILIAENPSLTNLTGFRILQRVRTLDVSRNSNLVELDLRTLGSARNVRITCNPALPESSLDALRTNVSGTIDVWGNQGSPATCAAPSDRRQNRGSDGGPRLVRSRHADSERLGELFLGQPHEASQRGDIGRLEITRDDALALRARIARSTPHP